MAIPVDRATGLPPLAGRILENEAVALAQAGTRAVGPVQAAISADERRLVFERQTASRNLFKVPIR